MDVTYPSWFSSAVAVTVYICSHFIRLSNAVKRSSKQFRCNTYATYLLKSAYFSAFHERSERDSIPVTLLLKNSLLLNPDFLAASISTTIKSCTSLPHRLPKLPNNPAGPPSEIPHRSSHHQFPHEPCCRVSKLAGRHEKCLRPPACKPNPTSSTRSFPCS